MPAWIDRLLRLRNALVRPLGLKTAYDPAAVSASGPLAPGMRVGIFQVYDVDEREVLIVFSDQDAYYRYVSHAYPDDGEFAFSSGMFLHAGCPHFVTVHDDETHAVERVIAHEMTHASVAHLSIPLWLNEGLAVNMEDRLMGRLPKLFTPAELRHKHLAFWSRDTIQEFWSGRSFGRPDDGNMLSYDLAQILARMAFLLFEVPPIVLFAWLAFRVEIAGSIAGLVAVVLLGIGIIMFQPR